MPCNSKILTKINESRRLVEALRKCGFIVCNATEYMIRTDGDMYFSRKNNTDSFTVNNANSKLAQVARKYAELGAREFANRRGYVIQSSSDHGMILIKRG
jgi:hypothetical protein